MSATILLALRIALAITLYAFVISALLILWRDLKRQSKGVIQTVLPTIKITTREDGTSESYEYTLSEVTIGRDPNSNCQLDDNSISAQHARLTYQQTQWWVEDLGSTNGTFLNQEPVTTPQVITSGDNLRCGRIVFQIQIGDIPGGDADDR
ncbi:MAG: FHA domain-containing protein [Anaerolineales bacterium]